MNYMLGKLPYKEDQRTLKWGEVLVEIPLLPASYKVDSQFKRPLPYRMWLNNIYGCCVLAWIANQTLRLEQWEQGLTVTILDSFIRNWYFKLTGGRDTGLVMLDTLKAWHKGWKINNNGRIYTIDAFAEVDRQKRDHLKAAIYLLNGVGMGVSLPQDFDEGWTTRDVWDVSGRPDSSKGHAIYCDGWDENGNWRIKSWARDYLLTDGFVQTYPDETWAVVDNRDKWMGDRSPVNVGKLNAYLRQVEG